MAKKPAAKITTSFNALNDLMNKLGGDGDILENASFAKIDEWIPTGYYILNAAFSGSLFGGIPNRRSVAFAGEQGTGKTFLALSCARNAQQMDEPYDILIFDSEGSIDTEFVRKLGVDISRVRVQLISTIEEFNHIAAQINKSFEETIAAGKKPPKIMIILDSLGNLSTAKEMNDSTEGIDKRDMTKQQGIRKMFRVNGTKFAKHGIPFIVNNHVYAAIGSFFGGNEISGGGGLKYNASIIMELYLSKFDDDESEENAKKKNVDAIKTGVVVNIKPSKQRFAKPIRTKIYIPFYKEPNPYTGLENFLSWENCGIVRGKCLSEKEYQKLEEKEQVICYPFETKRMVKEGRGKLAIETEQKVTLYVFPKDTSRSIVLRHEDCVEVPMKELWTSRVFTPEVLKELDEKVIKPTFMLPEVGSIEELEELSHTLIEEDVDEDGSSEDQN